MRKKWRDPEFRERLSQSHRRASDGSRARRAEKTRQLWRDPVYRDKQAVAREGCYVVVARDGKRRRVRPASLIACQLDGWEPV